MAEFIEDYKALENKAYELQLENQRLNKALVESRNSI